MMCTLAHMSVFTYFMATTKWLEAATDKAGSPTRQYVCPAAARKRQALRWSMSAIVVTMLAMFAGAGADPSIRPLWPSEVHLGMAMVAIASNLLCAIGEYRIIAEQGRQIDSAAARLAAPASTQ